MKIPQIEAAPAPAAAVYPGGDVAAAPHVAPAPRNLEWTWPPEWTYGGGATSQEPDHKPVDDVYHDDVDRTLPKNRTTTPGYVTGGGRYYVTLTLGCGCGWVYTCTVTYTHPTPKGNNMGTTKGNTPTPTPTPTPVTVVFTPPTPVTPKVRKGTSTVPNPVGTTFVYCLQQTHNNGGTPPSRGTLHTGVMGLGVTYYTTRTQVQRYLQWYNGGCNPTLLPKGVTLPKGLNLGVHTPK